ncbi:hypothetical protein [Phyllobacterium salinisoli]|uniref:hypothetical protein n=1 Tax=Phyllobacterium salinisoli TaxID=1899321 RepID=UPI001FE17E57|nr:hypothetical protein [Phyllobacterium salinisoli]
MAAKDAKNAFGMMIDLARAEPVLIEETWPAGRGGDGVEVAELSSDGYWRLGRFNYA